MVTVIYWSQEMMQRLIIMSLCTHSAVSDIWQLLPKCSHLVLPFEFLGCWREQRDMWQLALLPTNAQWHSGHCSEQGISLIAYLLLFPADVIPELLLLQSPSPCLNLGRWCQYLCYKYYQHNRQIQSTKFPPWSPPRPQPQINHMTFDGRCFLKL